MKKLELSETQKSLIRNTPNLKVKLDKPLDGRTRLSKLEKAAEQHFFNSQMSNPQRSNNN